MTGTGTQADPYKPTTWEEVLSCTANDGIYTDFPVTLVKTSDTQVKSFKVYLRQDGSVVKKPKTSEISTYYENTFVFDMNDYDPEGITSTIQLRGFINGKGATIKNAFYSGNDGAFRVSNDNSGGQIVGLNFTDFRFITSHTDTVFIEGSINSGTMYRLCQFSGRVENKGAQYCAITRGGYNATISRCSYNIEIEGNVSIDTGNWSAQLQYCNVNVTGITGNDTLNITPNNTFVSGSVNALTIEGSFGNAKESIIDVAASSISTANGGATLIPVNTDKYSGSLPSGCIGCTTAQLKDAEYLYSIEFPIQR